MFKAHQSVQEWDPRDESSWKLPPLDITKVPRPSGLVGIHVSSAEFLALAASSIVDAKMFFEQCPCAGVSLTQSCLAFC